MGRFFNNSAHSCGRFGLWVFPSYHPTASGSCWDTTPKAAKFEYFTSYGNDKGAEWVNSNNLQFRNMVVYDQATTGIETKSIYGNKGSNTNYKSTFFDENNGPLIADSIFIGNSDSSSSNSISESGMVIAWDRGQLLKSLSFYNFPNQGSKAIRGPFIIGTCTLDLFLLNNY